MARSGVYIPTSFATDIEILKNPNATNEVIREVLIRLYQNLDRIQRAINTRESSVYDFQEFFNGQTFPTTSTTSSTGTATNVRRQVYRKMIDFGALPNTALKSVAHGIDITSGFSFTRIYGAASDQAALTFIPIPNANTDIQINVDATNINITTSGNLSSYTITYIVIEYLKQ